MKHAINENEAAYLRPGREGIRIHCVQGNLWLTIKADHQDYILTEGDAMELKKGAKVAVMALSDARLRIEGCRFNLSEIKLENRQLWINRIRIRQAPHRLGAHPFRGRLPRWAYGQAHATTG